MSLPRIKNLEESFLKSTSESEFISANKSKGSSDDLKEFYRTYKYSEERYYMGRKGNPFRNYGLLLDTQLARDIDYSYFDSLLKRAAKTNSYHSFLKGEGIRLKDYDKVKKHKIFWKEAQKVKRIDPSFEGVLHGKFVVSSYIGMWVPPKQLSYLYREVKKSASAADFIAKHFGSTCFSALQLGFFHKVAGKKVRLKLSY